MSFCCFVSLFYIEKRLRWGKVNLWGVRGIRRLSLLFLLNFLFSKYAVEFYIVSLSLKSHWHLIFKVNIKIASMIDIARISINVTLLILLIRSIPPRLNYLTYRNSKSQLIANNSTHTLFKCSHDSSCKNKCEIFSTE